MSWGIWYLRRQRCSPRNGWWAMHLILFFLSLSALLCSARACSAAQEVYPHTNKDENLNMYRKGGGRIGYGINTLKRVIVSSQRCVCEMRCGRKRKEGDEITLNSTKISNFTRKLPFTIINILCTNEKSKVGLQES